MWRKKMLSLKLNCIDADEQSREELCRTCAEAGWNTQDCPTIDAFLTNAKRGGFSLFIYSHPNDSGEQSGDADVSRLKTWLDKHPQTQLILLLSEGFSSGDRLALTLGARHVLNKPYRKDDLTKILAMVAQGVGERKRRNALTKRLKSPEGFEEIIGISNQIRELIALSKKVAVSDSTSIMITGECGTGKGALAKAIHLASPRSSGPFIEINCAAIPRNLLESEFFGYEKGAFTDAKDKKIGLFECANGGTIFLDEVGEIDISLQAKLLKFLDTRVIRRISGTQFLPVDVRVIAATNRDLKADVSNSIFRSDLFYRLNVIEILIPPLRERPADIRPIAEAYTEKFSSRLKKSKITLTEDAIKALEQYSWPGNIRELINIIERAVLLNTDGTIEPVEIPIERKQQEATIHIKKEKDLIIVDLPPEGAPLEAIEKGTIITALERSGGNTTKAARFLEVGRGTLRYKMKKYGIVASEAEENSKNGQYEPISETD